MGQRVVLVAEARDWGEAALAARRRTRGGTGQSPRGPHPPAGGGEDFDEFA